MTSHSPPTTKEKEVVAYIMQQIQLAKPGYLLCNDPFALSRLVSSCLVLSCLVVSCPCRVVSCRGVSFVSGRVVSRLVLSCLLYLSLSIRFRCLVVLSSRFFPSIFFLFCLFSCRLVYPGLFLFSLVPF